MTTARLLATWFGSGLAPRAPGTCGSLAALPFAWVIASWGGPYALLVAAIAVFVLGIWAAGATARAEGRGDPGEVVIDEVAGIWLTLVPVTPTLLHFALGFALFRLFDIWKPWPVSLADRSLHGGLGIMADDVLAAGYAALCLWLLSGYLP